MKLEQIVALIAACAVATSGCAAPDADSSADLGTHTQALTGVTRDVGATLAEIAEHDLVRGSCDRHFARLDPATDRLPPALANEPEARRDEILCGKDIFMFGGFGVVTPFPGALLRALLATFPDVTGPSFTKLGFLPDPRGGEFPLGIVETYAVGGTSNSLLPSGGDYTLTCSTCHVGKTADGRFAIAMPNEQLQMGKFAAMMNYTLWLADSAKDDSSRWPPKLLSFYRTLWWKSLLRPNEHRWILDLATLPAALRLTQGFYDLIKAPVPGYPELEAYLEERPGVPNILATVLGGNKVIYAVPPQIWGIQNQPGDVEAGRAATLTNFLPVSTLEDFLHDAFIIQTSTDDFSRPRWIDPVAAYVRTLRAPAPLSAAPDATLVARGKDVFTRTCTSCHDAPLGDGTAYVRPSQINAHASYDAPSYVGFEPNTWLSRDTYDLLVDAHLDRGEILPTTYEGMKVRRLHGVASRTKLMSSGVIRGLAHALCLDGQTRSTANAGTPFSEAVHGDLCMLPLDERVALRAMMLTLY